MLSIMYINPKLNSNSKTTAFIQNANHNIILFVLYIFGNGYYFYKPLVVVKF